MGPPVHEDLSLGETHKGQITNEVKQLMAHRLIGEPQRGVDPVIAITDQGVIQGPALNQASRPQLLNLLTESKGARRSDLLDEHLRGEIERQHLPTNGRLRKIDDAHHAEGIGRGDGDHTATAMA